MKANEMQVGGEHYRSDYQHWDFCVNVALGYLEGNATRYVSRWRKKGGIEDLQKALHYVDKLLEALPQVVGWRGERIVGYEYALEEAISFCDLNELTSTESSIVRDLATWRCREDVVLVRCLILALIDEAKEPVPIPATDSNKHAIAYNDWPGIDETIPF